MKRIITTALFAAFMFLMNHTALAGIDSGGI